MTSEKSLPERIVEIANRDNISFDHPMVVAGEAFRSATADKEASAKRILGCWARARRLWCEYTGESLV